MKNKKIEDIIKSHSDLLNQDEQTEIVNDINNSKELFEFNNLLRRELSDLKEIRDTFPDDSFVESKVNKVVERSEEKIYSKMHPSFAYSMIISFLIIISSQFISFNSENEYYELNSLLESVDLDEYISTNDLIYLNNTSSVKIGNSEIEYLSYLYRNPVDNYSVGSFEYELISVIEESVQEKIYNEILNKNILGK